MILLDETEEVVGLGSCAPFQLAVGKPGATSFLGQKADPLLLLVGVYNMF